LTVLREIRRLYIRDNIRDNFDLKGIRNSTSPHPGRMAFEGAILSLSRPDPLPLITMRAEELKSCKV